MNYDFNNIFTEEFIEEIGKDKKYENLLKNIARANCRESPELTIYIIGHTGSLHSREDNLIYSKKMAEKFLELLFAYNLKKLSASEQIITEDVRQSCIKVWGLGENYLLPDYSSDSPAQWRIEIIIYKYKTYK